MDDPHVDAVELRRALAALRTTNRRLGGTRAVIRACAQWMDRWPTDRPARVLDIATGSADIPLALVAWAKREGREIEVVAVDLHEKTLAVAREQTAETPQITVMQADALRLMDHFQANAFDVVHAGLFLHHLADIEVLTMLRIMDRLASQGLIWNDLIRSRMTKLAVVPFSWFGPRVFRHDSLAAKDAGFTKGEAMDLARRVGLQHVRYRAVLAHRFLLTSESPAVG